MWKQFRLFAGRAAALMICICNAQPRAASPLEGQPMLILQDFALSPDGRLVAFEYRDLAAGRNNLGVGVLDRGSGKLMHVPNPQDKQLSTPSFSYDGRRLVAAMGHSPSLEPSQIVTVDLDAWKVTEITPSVPVGSKGFAFKQNPVFQPGTNDVLYVQNDHSYSPKHLELLNPADQTTKTILGPNEGFYAIFQPSFIGPEEILFQAIGPHDPLLKQSVIKLLGKEHYDPLVDTIAYRLRFGGRPEIFLPELTKALTGPLLPGITDLTASRDGDAVVFAGLSLLHPKDERRQWNYEIFKLEGGQTQLTDVRSFLADAHISYDGTTVAFGSDPTRRKLVDLFILDVRSRKITATGLLERLQRSREFWLH